MSQASKDYISKQARCQKNLQAEWIRPRLTRCVRRARWNCPTPKTKGRKKKKKKKKNREQLIYV
ncbi:hypothetical protein QCA50_017868 [Cerrena zonata]|uniref:Uncharacterized protein n=1 Tax=Cerrena zonata TaxID=2478898 RepID=A0AAW0FHU4_9APHY